MEQSESDQQLEDLDLDLVPFVLLNLEAEADSNIWELNNNQVEFVSFRISILRGDNN